MNMSETIRTSPLDVEKSVRGEEVRVLTSCKAGVIVPVTYIPMLREDRVSRGNISLKLDMAETIHPLMNAVNVTAYVHYVPYLAFDRFEANGLTALNRSYKNEPEPGGGVIPFVQTVPFDKNHAFWKALGVHWPQNAPISVTPVQAYNAIVNHRRKARSKHLALQPTEMRSALARAFWKNTNLSHIVPDFDDAAIDGEVTLQFDQSKLPVRSKTWQSHHSTGGKAPSALDNSFTPTADGVGWYSWGNEVFVEMSQANVSVNLANIELAKQTAAFAKARDRYKGVDDEYLLDLLMSGIRVPDEALKQPILLDRKSTIFGYSERHAMDGASLDRSVTTGETTLDLSFRTPPMNSGGVIMVTLEIVPEQLYERQRDQFLGITDPVKFPEFVRDFLDPQQVDVVRNKYVDVHHADPEGIFGYAPQNHEWRRSLTRIGGKYYRPTPDTFVEDRQRFWSVEQLNPTLTEDFWVVRNLPHSVFMDTISDPFEVLALGNVQIVGNTVFGKTLEEDQGNYELIADQVDTSRIVPAE